MDRYGYKPKIPTANIFGWRSSFGNPKSSHKRLIYNHPFNHQVDLLLPSLNIEAAETGKLLVDSLISHVTSDFYYIVNIPLHCLLEPNFIYNNVKDKKLYGTTILSQLDCDNGCALLPSGKMVIQVDKDTHETLGIQGKRVMKKYRHVPERYNIEIDLLADSFKPGKKGYDRIYNKIKNKLTNVTLLLSCFNDVGECQEIQFPEKETMFIKRFTTETKTIPHSQLSIPYFSSSSLPFLSTQPNRPTTNLSSSSSSSSSSSITEESFCMSEDMLRYHMQQMIDWIGYVHCSALYSSSSSSASTTTTTTSSSSSIGIENMPKTERWRLNPSPEYKISENCLHVQLVGFIAPHRIEQILKALSQLEDLIKAQKENNNNNNNNNNNANDNESFNWVSLTVLGFTDSVVSWENHERALLFSGDNNYSFIVFPQVNCGSKNKDEKMDETENKQQTQHEKQQEEEEDIHDVGYWYMAMPSYWDTFNC